MNPKIIFNYINTIIRILPIKKIQIGCEEISFLINENYLLKFLLFLKLHTLCQYEILSCISCVDYPTKQNRFEIIYELLSIRFNNRIKLKTQINQIKFIESCEKIYPSSGWHECEIFDMFGLFFTNHNNLTRILTDYGFEGFPLRKDFPLSGYIEIKYDEKQKRIISEFIELAQEYRTFNFSSPWNEKIKLNEIFN